VGVISFCSVAITIRPKLVGSLVGQSVAGGAWGQPVGEHSGYLIKQGIKRGVMWMEFSMSPTIAEWLEHARQCEWYAARTNDEEDRQFLLRKAKDWTKLAIKKELEIRAAVKTAA
jgi:hypothetical protein